ncbi:hypothetical protein PInf_020298 [Phytophthora infestans]|nr:hypothetical protein PInf_020298 [Phytophthora infestans]
MFGVGLALALVACGVVFIVLGFHVQEAERKAQAALLFKWMPKPTAAETSAAFLNYSTFIFAMDAPEFTSFYLWNLTNAEDLLAGGGTIQPKLAQVGPYTYEKRTRKLNVSFHTIEDEAYDSDSYSAVSYQVASTYHFSAERSTGSESDLVVTLNASYVRHLTKLHAQTGRTERFLAAEFAHAHIRDYVRHLQSDFVAATKLRALRALLPEMMARVKREGMAAVINRQRRRVGDANLPAALVRMHAVARTEQIPVMLRDVYRDQTDVALPSLLTKQFGLARRQAVPRVLSNMLNRLHVEAVPALLGRQIETQQTNFVPRTLASLNIKMQRVAFPFERACLEVVPFVLRAIKNEIVARDVATNQATIDNAKLAVINLWRQQGSSPTDLDAWIDDSPTNQERTGFELLPATSSLELSLEAATLLLGSRPSNLRFSLVDYDPVQTAADGLDGPQTTATGFAIWKALNETAIDCVIESVNNDVALAADYLTREQLMAIRDYIIVWAQSGIVQRDRQRYWRNAFAKRTISSDRSDPEVDLDLERVGIQAGFSLQPLSTSSGGTTVSADVAQQVWNSSSTNFSFVDPAGFTKWLGIVDGSTTASTSGLLAGVTGITSAEVSAILTWIKALLDDGFIRRRALRHWADGTCTTVMHLTRHNGCLRYDLEPNTDGLQLGFEMNPEAVAELGSGISENARNVLWDVTEGVSFLRPVHSSDTKYYAGWVRAIRTSNYARLIDDSQQLTTLAVTGVSAQAIGRWLRSWAHNELYKFTVYYWWLRSTCWPRVELSETQVGSATVTTGELECKETSTEQEQSTAATSANVSPFFTDVRTYQVTEVTCTTTGPTFTKTQTIYTRQARVFSCDMVSTSLADDQDGGTVGFELAPMAQNDAERISLAAAISLWNPVNELSFRNTQGYENVLATPDVDLSKVAPMNVVFELNQTTPVDISIEAAQVIWDAQSDFSLLASDSFFKKWYPAIDRSTALLTVQSDLDTLADSSTPSDLSVVQDYIVQWENSDAAALSVCSLWISTNVASVDVDVHQIGDQRGFELYRNGFYKGAVNSLTLPTLAQAKKLWNTASVYSIVKRDVAVDDAGLPTGFRAWEEMYEGMDYEAEHLVAQYSLTEQVIQPATMAHTLNEQERAQLLAAMVAETSLSEAQIRGVARWLFHWATDDSLRDFVLFQWATGDTFRGDSELRLDFGSHLERLYSFPVTSEMSRDYFTAASPVLADASSVTQETMGCCDHWILTEPCESNSLVSDQRDW